MQIHQRAQWGKGKENFFSLWNLFENCLKIKHVNANGFKHVVQITWNQPKKPFLVIPIKFFLFSRYNRHCTARGSHYGYMTLFLRYSWRIWWTQSLWIWIDQSSSHRDQLQPQCAEEKAKTIRNLSVIVFLENCKTVIQLPSSLLLWVVVTEPSF